MAQTWKHSMRTPVGERHEPELGTAEGVMRFVRVGSEVQLGEALRQRHACIINLC